MSDPGHDQGDRVAFGIAAKMDLVDLLGTNKCIEGEPSCHMTSTSVICFLTEYCDGISKKLGNIKYGKL
jgi:hypothetical protein